MTTKYIWNNKWALARWLSWLEYHPINRNIVGSIFSQGTYLGWRVSLQLRYILEATDWCLSLTLISLTDPLSLSHTHTNKHIFQWGVKNEIKTLRRLLNTSGLPTQLKIAVRPSGRLCNYSLGPKSQLSALFDPREKGESQPIQNSVQW